MSTVRRRLQVDVVGNTGSFDAAMNRVNAGLSRVGSGLRGGRKEAGLFNRQIMAIGTTARYYLAGQLVFGVMSAVNSLGQFKQELGQIDALAGQMQNGRLGGLGGELADVGQQALLMSNKFGIAVGDVESYMQRFFSSFNPPGTAKQRVGEMTVYTDAVLKLVAALGKEAGDPQKLAGGLTGLINATPGGRQNPGRTAKQIADMFAVVLRGTPALTGQDIASAAGRFAQAKTLARMDIPQIMSAFGVASQLGGSPAVIIRGLTQLLGSSLMHPTKPASLRAYQAAGLPVDPNALAAMGGQKVLERLIVFAQQGNRGKGKSNLNLDMIYNAFSRQESVRQFVALLSQGGVPALRKFNDELKKGVKNDMSGQMARARLRQSTIVRMQNARVNLGTALVGGADWPLEHLIADPLIGLSNQVIRHRTTSQAVMGGALGLGAANALRRLGMFSKLGRFGKVGSFLGAASGIQQAAIGGAIAKEELPAAIMGGATDGTRGNPFWVIISPLSWSIGSPGGFSSPVPPGSKVPRVIPFAKKFSKFGKAVPYVGLGVLAFEGLDHFSAESPGRNKFMLNNALGGLEASKLNPMLDALARAHVAIDRVQSVEVTGKAHANITVRLVDKNGNELVLQEKKGVPIRLIPAKQFPTAKAKPGSRKGQT